jgi:hypothetical protein
VGSYLYRLVKKAHLLRSAQSPRSNVLHKYASARRFVARLAAETFLTSLGKRVFQHSVYLWHWRLEKQMPGFAVLKINLDETRLSISEKRD